LAAQALHTVSEHMVVAADNIFLSITIIAAFLCLVLMGRAKGQRMKLILGGVGVAAAMVALALLAESLTGSP
jgi:uncharacterized membrane protein